MVIDDFDIPGILPIPAETNAILVIHANAMLALAVSLEGFQPIAGWDAKFVEGLDGIDLRQFAQGGLMDRRR